MQAAPDSQEEFDFFMRFVKPLVLNLPDSSDRVKSASWIQKLRAAKSDINRNDYLKLLLFVLHRKQLIGVFAENPPPGNRLEPLPENLDLVHLAHNMVEVARKEGGAGDPPPYSVEVSADQKEYAVSQSIPKFGTHFLYAVSKQPISEWTNAKYGFFPKGPRNFAVNIFETTSPSMAAMPAKAIPHLDDLEERAMGGGLNRPSCAGSDNGFKWLEKLDQPEDFPSLPGKCDQRGPEEWNAFNGQEEIEKQEQEFCTDLLNVRNSLNPGRTPSMSRNLRDDNDFEQTMEIINSARGPAARASMKLVRRSESAIDITQGHYIQTTDPDDHSVMRLQKAMKIQDENEGGQAMAYSQGGNYPAIGYSEGRLAQNARQQQPVQQQTPKTSRRKRSPALAPHEKLLERFTPSGPIKHRSFHNKDNKGVDQQVELFEWVSGGTAGTPAVHAKVTHKTKNEPLAVPYGETLNVDEEIRRRGLLWSPPKLNDSAPGYEGSHEPDENGVYYPEMLQLRYPPATASPARSTSPNRRRSSNPNSSRSGRRSSPRDQQLAIALPSPGASRKAQRKERLTLAKAESPRSQRRQSRSRSRSRSPEAAVCYDLAVPTDPNAPVSWTVNPFEMEDEENLEYNRQIFKEQRDPFFKGIPLGPGEFYGAGPATQAMRDMQAGTCKDKQRVYDILDGKGTWYPEDEPQPEPEPEPEPSPKKDRRSSQRMSQQAVALLKRQSASPSQAVVPYEEVDNATPCSNYAQDYTNYTQDEEELKQAVEEHRVRENLWPEWDPPPEYYLSTPEQMQRKRDLNPNYSPGWRDKDKFWAPWEFDMSWYVPPNEIYFAGNKHVYAGPDPMDTTPIPDVERGDIKRGDFTFLDVNQNRQPFDMDDREELARKRKLFKEQRDPYFRGIPLGSKRGARYYYGAGPATKANRAIKAGTYRGDIVDLCAKLEGKKSWFPDDDDEDEIPPRKPCPATAKEDRLSQIMEEPGRPSARSRPQQPQPSRIPRPIRQVQPRGYPQGYQPQPMQAAQPNRVPTRRLATGSRKDKRAGGKGPCC